MLELIFVNRETGKVVYAINNIKIVRYITPSEVGFADDRGHIRSAPLILGEKLEVQRQEEIPSRALRPHITRWM